MRNKPEWEPPELTERKKVIIVVCMTIIAFVLLAMIGGVPK